MLIHNSAFTISWYVNLQIWRFCSHWYGFKFWGIQKQVTSNITLINSVVSIFLELVQVSLEIDAYRHFVLPEKPVIAHWISVAADCLLCQKSTDVIGENKAPFKTSPLFVQSRYLPRICPSKILAENTDKSLTRVQSKHVCKVQHNKLKENLEFILWEMLHTTGILFSQRTACSWMIRY